MLEPVVGIKAAGLIDKRKKRSQVGNDGLVIEGRSKII
jgi:hypothetical protein